MALVTVTTFTLCQIHRSGLSSLLLLLYFQRHLVWPPFCLYATPLRFLSCLLTAPSQFFADSASSWPLNIGGPYPLSSCPSFPSSFFSPQAISSHHMVSYTHQYIHQYADNYQSLPPAFTSVLSSRLTCPIVYSTSHLDTYYYYYYHYW